MGDRRRRRNWKLKQSGCRELAESFKRYRRLACTVTIDGTALVMKYLLHPETADGTVKTSQKTKIVVIGSRFWQFDHRGRTIKNRFITIQHKMIMCSNERHRD